MRLAIAFLAGLVSGASPCVLPVVPVYASYVVGGVGSRAMVAPGGSPTGRALGFLTGFFG